MLSERIEIVEAPLDDSWMRDNGPIFVRNAAGELALVDFGFNAWGEADAPYALDDQIPALVASHLGVRRYVAPMILEGGSFFVDGAGAFLTTEQCLLHENRNPGMDRAQIEATLGDYLGVDRIVWLDQGHYEDFSTDGHVDDIAHFLAPGKAILHTPSNPAHPDHAKGQENVRRLREAQIEVVEFDTGREGGIPYLNLYVCNGGIVAPTGGAPEDEMALAQIRAVYPDREIATVQCDVLFLAGGGGPHCITQQVPVGAFG